MAAAIAAMFAIPGSASALWTKDHATNASNQELEITGTDMYFETSLGGVTCLQTISKIVLEGNSPFGRVKSFAPEIINPQLTTVTDVCQGRGSIAQCDVHEATADNLPWTIETESSATVRIETGTITNTLTGFFCPHTLQLTPGSATMTVAAGETNTTSTATLNPLSGWFKTDGSLGSEIATT
ncbi:MAG TPA: hypothetical protein VFR04_03335, partial [Solirubrobacterales bacterium]|nr:hypothetical protein [Solirubrobacterales bacterium]